MHASINKINILIVDDEFVFRELNKKQINSYLKDNVNFEIFVAEGLEKALEIAKKVTIDVVFTDMQMDNKRDCGLALTRKIKSINMNTHVFITSNAILNYLQDRSDAAGLSGIFQLPLNEADLKIAFGHYMHGHK
ncbi:MAG: response regulator [Desulfobacteraceae bacterium]|nr:response regulator [Desulfobacteraceae bacterium]